MGSKRRPYYRIVAIDSHRSVGGRTLETLGNYSPIEVPASVTVHEANIFKWLDTGAICSDTVASLFTQIGLTEKYLAQKAGKDVAEMVVKTTISERTKKRKSKKSETE